MPNDAGRAAHRGHHRFPNRDAAIGGPYDVTGVSDFEVRENILTCHPDEGDEARPCAEEIVRRLAREAYRRPLEEADVDALMALYDDGAAEGGFESGVQVALQGILASPDFLFRMEEPTEEVAEDGVCQMRSPGWLSS